MCYETGGYMFAKREPLGGSDPDPLPRVKEFSCPKCHCKRFWRRRVIEILVDFGQEGTIGCPKLEGPEKPYTIPNFVCAECGSAVSMAMCKEMEEVL